MLFFECGDSFSLKLKLWGGRAVQWYTAAPAVGEPKRKRAQQLPGFAAAWGRSALAMCPKAWQRLSGKFDSGVAPVIHDGAANPEDTFIRNDGDAYTIALSVLVDAFADYGESSSPGS